MTWFNTASEPQISVDTFNTFPEDYQRVVIKYIAVAWYYDITIYSFDYGSCTFISGPVETVEMNMFMIDKLIAKIDKKWLRCYPLREYGFTSLYGEFFPDENS